MHPICTQLVLVQKIALSHSIIFLHSIAMILLIFLLFAIQNKNTNEIDELKHSLETTLDRLNTQSDDADRLIRSLNGRIKALQTDLFSIQTELEK